MSHSTQKMKSRFDAYLPGFMYFEALLSIAVFQSHSISFSHSYRKVESLDHYYDSTVQLQKINTLIFSGRKKVPDSHQNMFVTKVSSLNIMGK